MTEQNKQLFFEFAKQQFPREACAILISEAGSEVLVNCRNIAHDKEDFEIHPDDYADAEDRGEIIGIVHSHPKTAPRPTMADLVGCEKSKVQWHIVGVLTGDWFEFEPSNFKAPLIGREWCHGVLDCYSIIRDYYKEELNIDLPDFVRQPEWWLKGDNLYLDNFSKAGFIQVPFDSLKKHDVILMQLRSRVINHGGVYLGDGIFLHHLWKKLSSRDNYGGYWAKNTVKIVRYEGLDAQDKALR